MKYITFTLFSLSATAIDDNSSSSKKTSKTFLNRITFDVTVSAGHTYIDSDKHTIRCLNKNCDKIKFFKTLTVSSEEPLTSCFPLGEKFTEWTQFLCPKYVFKWFLSSKSHSWKTTISPALLTMCTEKWPMFHLVDRNSLPAHYCIVQQQFCFPQTMRKPTLAHQCPYH